MSHSKPHISELIFEVREEAEGGYSAECLTENILTQGATWEELRANVKEATEAYFFDGPRRLACPREAFRYLPRRIPAGRCFP